MSHSSMADSNSPWSFAIVPAAGRSRRMGRPKLLLTHAGRSVVEHALAAWRASQVTQVVVVVHPDDRRLSELCQAAGVTVVRPKNPPPEMKDSVNFALAEIAARYQPTDRDVWLLAPADMPELSAATIDLVLAAHRDNAQRIVVPTHGGRRGHPVLFPWALAAEVAALGDDQGINAIVSRHEVREIEVPDQEILVDLDTPDDFERWRHRHGKGQSS